jgi:hypothetical protein
MQRGLQDAPSRAIFRDAHTTVLAQGGFVGAVNRPEQAPTSNQGGFVVADRQPPMRQPRLTEAAPPAAEPGMPVLHALQRQIFAVETDGRLTNTMQQTTPTILLPSPVLPVPVAEAVAEVEHGPDICVLEWSTPAELEQLLMQPIAQPYVLALPHNAVVLRPVVASDHLPEGCDMLVMATLTPGFPCDPGIVREIQRTRSESPWWCPHLGAWLARTAFVQQTLAATGHSDWSTQFHHAWSQNAQLDLKCTLFQDLDLQYPLVGGIYSPPTLPLHIVVICDANPQYATRAACQYHSLGYTDVTVCSLRHRPSLAKDVPWARYVHADTLDAALLQAMLGSQDAVLLHHDTVVPSATTIRKLHRAWSKAPAHIHALSGLRWQHGHFQPAVEVRAELVDLTCCLLARAGLPRYFQLLSDLRTYHQLGQQQFPEVGLSFAFAQPHYVHGKLASSLECHLKQQREPSRLDESGLEDVVYDAWVQQCAAWAA